jgi:hypothetical protein
MAKMAKTERNENGESVVMKTNGGIANHQRHRRHGARRKSSIAGGVMAKISWRMKISA